MAPPPRAPSALRARRVLTALTVLVLLALPSLRAVAAPPEVPPSVGQTPHFHVHAEPGARASAERVLAVAEERFSRVCGALDACAALKGPIAVWVAEDPERFAAAFPGATPMTEWAAGVAFIEERRLVLRAHGSALFSLLETFDHEVAHLLLHALAGGRHVPRWASEGLAIWASGEDVVGRLDAAHRAAVFGNLMPLDALDGAFPDRGSRVPLAYAQSALFTRHLVGRFGPGALPRVLARVGTGDDFESAFTARFGAPAASLALDWAESLESEASPFILMHDGSVLWLLMTLAFIYVGFKQNRQRKLAFARMAEEDVEDDARREAERAFAELEAQRATGEPPTLH